MHGLSLGPETFKRPARFRAGASFCCVARCSDAVEPGVGSVLGHSPSPSAGPCPPGPQCGPAASGLGPGAQDRHLPSLPYHARRPAPQPSAGRRRRRVRSLRLATGVGGAPKGGGRACRACARCFHARGPVGQRLPRACLCPAHPSFVWKGSAERGHLSASANMSATCAPGLTEPGQRGDRPSPRCGARCPDAARLTVC